MATIAIYNITLIFNVNTLIYIVIDWISASPHGYVTDVTIEISKEINNQLIFILMKILALQSKYNSHCCDTIICEDNEVDAIVAEKGDKFNIVVNNWFG